MYISEIIKPGTWLDYENRDWSREVETILNGLESQFYDANLALNMFLSSLKIDETSYSEEYFEAASKRRAEIQKEVEKKYENLYDSKVLDEIQFETGIRFKREQWQSGKLPREFEHNQPFIHARTFLYALDSFASFLNVLKKHEGASPELSEIHAGFFAAFPNLRAVRNTAHHMEDRYRGLGAETPPKPLKLKPVDTPLVRSKGGVLVLNSLNGTKYGNTMADGHYGEIDVSPESMKQLQAIFQDILNAFKWKGPKRHLPSI